MSVLTELDREQLYTLRDQMEVWWRFIWEPTPDMRGWFAWRKDPAMDKWVCIGTLSDERVLQVVNSQPPPLTTDDSIDFHLAMRRYGWKEKEDNLNDSSKTTESEEGAEAQDNQAGT